MLYLIGTSVLCHIAFNGSRVAVALAALELKASPFAIGLILSFYSLLPMFLSVPGGRWVDRVGMRQPMVGGTALLAFGVLVPALAWDIGALYLSPILIGLGFMAFHLCVQKASGEIGGPEKRRDNFSQLALGFSISNFAGPTLSGFLIDHIGHRPAFAVLAIFPLMAVIALARWKMPHEMTHRSQGLELAETGGKVLDLLALPELRRLYIAVVLVSSAWDVHQFVVPLYGAQHGLSASQIGLVLGAFAAATFVSRLALPLVARRLGEWALILFAMGTAIMVFALYPLFPKLPWMLTLSFVLGLGLGVAQPMMLSVMHAASPPGRIGEAVGLRLTLVNGTQTLLPTLYGALGSALGLAPVFWGMSAMVAAGFAYSRRSGRSKPGAHHGRPVHPAHSTHGDPPAADEPAAPPVDGSRHPAGSRQHDDEERR